MGVFGSGSGFLLGVSEAGGSGALLGVFGAGGAVDIAGPAPETVEYPTRARVQPPWNETTVWGPKERRLR